MSAFQLPEDFNPPELQIWNNAAFDDGDSEDSSAIRACWSNLPPDCMNDSLDSGASKENQIPPSVFSSFQSSASIVEPLRSSNIREKPPKVGWETPSAKSKTVKVKHGTDQPKRREDRNIDAEIEEVEKEISRLSARLESLRLEKAEQTARSIAVRGRIVPAKFMEPPKLTAKNHHETADASFSGMKSKINRRGVSLGPAEIFSAANKSGTVTPLQSAQNRRKSCFWKLPEIEEGKATKARGRMSLSLSPRSRRAASKIEAAQKQAATTVGSKRAVKKEEGLLLSIQPKRLFKDGEKSVPSKKPLKPGRMVASRYSQSGKAQAGEKEARKRSLPENEEKENNNRSEKRRASDENDKNLKSEGRVKKRWEIPSQVVVYKSDETPIDKELPKIRTLRLAAESPRDSGAAKRVAELEGKERYFNFCQSLRFEGED